MRRGIEVAVSASSQADDDPPKLARRPQGKLIQPMAVNALLVLTLFAFAAHPARADITYTWHEDDGQTVTGSLVVNAVAQQNGTITSADVVSFAFDTPSAQFSTITSDSFPLLISTTDASPNAISQSISSSASPSTVFSVKFNLGWNTTQEWVTSDQSTEKIYTGLGYWTISGAQTPSAVPEPSTAFVAVFGSVAFLAYGWSRHRRAQRRQVAA